MLAVYVDNLSNYTIIGDMTGDYRVTNDVGTTGTLDAGDTVTWLGRPGAADDVGGLIWGTDGFASIQATAAIGEMINVGPGTFTKMGQGVANFSA